MTAGWLAALALAVTGPAAAQDTAGAGSVAGLVVWADGTPAPAVAVCIREPSRCEVTDARGGFTIESTRAGHYTLEVSGLQLPVPVTAAIDVRAGLTTRVTVELPRGTALTDSVTVSAPRFSVAEELKNSVYLAGSEDVWKSAGAQQDVVRYVQTLPGVAIGTDDFRNDLIVRGGSPLENLYIVDNVEVPNVNTFATFASAGGTVSMLDALAIDGVTFTTGGFPASFGNRTSSVLQVTLREGRRDRIGGRVAVGFAGAGGLVEGPIGRSQRGSWLVSARRSFLDAFTNDTGIGGVPVLYTLNAKATYDFTPRDRVWAVNVTGYDTVRLGLTESSDPTSELSNLDIHYRGWRTVTGVNWQRTYGARGVGLLGVTHTFARVDQNVRDLLVDGIPDPITPIDQQLVGGVTVFREQSGETQTSVKYDATLFTRVLGKLQVGGAVTRVGADYDTTSPYGTDSPYFAEPNQHPFGGQFNAADWLSGGYVQGTRAFGRFSATAGARLDRYAYLNATRLSPRGSLALEVTPNVSLRASAGRYYQQPFFLFLAAFSQNRQLVPYSSDHLVGGLAWTPSAGTRVTVEGYVKQYSDYPVSSDVPALSLANVGDTFALRDVLFPLVRGGRGRSEGVELYAERLASRGRRWYGQANLAVSRSRQAGLDRVRRPSSFDYPIVVNLTGTWRVTSAWEASVRASALSGRPYTPIDAALSAAQHRTVYDTAFVNDGRLPAYARIDVRIDRRFSIWSSTLDLFGGVQNITNRQNVSGYSWDRRNNVLRLDTQLGAFPILGLEWRFGG